MKPIERYRRPIGFALIYLAVGVGLAAAWILIAPRNFYEEFPVAAEWASALPPRNEHLIRDFGSASLGLAVLACLAAVWMERRLVQATAVAFFAGLAPTRDLPFDRHRGIIDRRQPLQPGRALLGRAAAASGPLLGQPAAAGARGE
jgi:hypothetical protein